MVNPHRGYVHWQIRDQSAKALKKKHGEKFNDSHIVVRVYDVTDILFDGLNAHMFFDLEVNGFSGNHYFSVDRLGRSYLAEIGFRFGDGSFHYLARSNTASFDLDRPSGDYQIAGLFVGRTPDRMFSVKNIFDAPVYEKVNEAFSMTNRKVPLSVSAVFLDLNHAAGESPLRCFVKKSCQGLDKFGGRARLFTPFKKDVRSLKGKSLIKTIDDLSKKMRKQIIASHDKTPYQLIHCHDWYSSAVGHDVARRLNLPMVLTLYSTEYERAGATRLSRLSSAICRREKKAIEGAHLVIVPNSSTREQVTKNHGAPPEKVVIIPYSLTKGSGDNPSNPSEVRRWFGLSQDAPVVLFAGEMSHAAGADLLVESLPTVCRNIKTAHFVFAGEGPLKQELEGRAFHAGIGHRCRFVGDVSGEMFEALLMASDFVVIPARTWQDPRLAQTAISCGRPVLTTHQAGLDCVAHGENGLVTFDNSGSIVWGIQELLSNPLQGSMLRLVARKSASEAASIENAAARHYIYYEDILKDFRGATNA